MYADSDRSTFSHISYIEVGSQWHCCLLGMPGAPVPPLRAEIPVERGFAAKTADTIDSRNITNTFTWPQRWPRTLALPRGLPS